MQSSTRGTENCDGRGLMTVRDQSEWVQSGVAGGCQYGWPTLTNYKVGTTWAWLSIKPTPKCPWHMRDLCEQRVLDLVIDTRMQQGILGFVKRNYWSNTDCYVCQHWFWCFIVINMLGPCAGAWKILKMFICTKSVNWGAKRWEISRGVSLGLQLATTLKVFS